MKTSTLFLAEKGISIPDHTTNLKSI